MIVVSSYSCKSWAKLTLKLVSYEVDCQCLCILKLSFTFKVFTILGKGTAWW